MVEEKKFSLSVTENKVRRFLTPEELNEHVVDWSKKTLDRRIKEDGFPAIRDGNSVLIPFDEMLLWFKRRKI